jgi:hypothetical protein
MKVKSIDVYGNGGLLTVRLSDGASVGLTAEHSAKVLREIEHLLSTHPHLYGKDL